MVSLLIRYLKDYQLQIVLVVIFVFSQAVCQLYLPGMMGNIVDNGVAKGDIGYVLQNGAMMLALSLFAAVCMAASSYYSAYVTASFTSRIRADVFNKVKNFSQPEFNRFGEASLLTRSTADATQMQFVVINGLRSLLLVPITGVGALLMAYRENALLTLVLLGAFALTTLIIWITTAKSLPLFALRQAKLDRLNLLIKEKLTGVRAIRAFRRQEYETAKFSAANEDSRQASLTANYAVAFFTPFLQAMLNITMVIILWLGAAEIQQKVILLGDLMVFIQYVLLFMSALSLVSVLLTAYPQAQVSALRVKEVLDSDYLIKDPPHPQPFEQPAGRIAFNQVSFGYSGAENQVLKNLNFVAEPGKVTAVIGATGSGKTTLLQLIMRLYEVTAGSITIDGIDIRACRQHDLRQAITYAPQQSIVFGGTVADNIRFGAEQATDEAVIEAAKIAQIYDTVMQRKNGLNSTLYPGGKDLSGGQRQRLSIARALLKQAPIVLLDDCFSALDAKTDGLVRSGMQKKWAGATVILVAQRISTIKAADHILVLDNGTIAGQGTHAELLKNCSVYQEIAASQAYLGGRDETL